MSTQTKVGGFLKPLLLLSLGLALIGTAYWLTGPSREEHRKRSEFIAREVPALLDQEEESNRQALKRAQQELRKNFQRYRAKVPDFVEELTSGGLEFKLTKASLTDWWSETNEARNIATELFSEKVVSNEGLEQDIQAVANQFVTDLTANRNGMLSELSIRVSASQLQVPTNAIGNSGAVAVFQEKLKLVLDQRATEAPVVVAISITGDRLAEEVVKRLVRDVNRSLATRLAATAIARGGAAAGGAAGGGAVGTALFPGVGTAIGVVAGLAAGFAVDKWMEGRFKEQVTKECDLILRALESEVWHAQQQGLNAKFSQMITETRAAHEAALKLTILGGSK